MSISLIASTIAESATLKLNETAALLREKGDPVIHLGGGEPKSDAPLDALTSAAGMLNSGKVRYTPADGTRALKKAIIRYTDDFYHRKVEPENVIASSGAKQAIMVALQAVVDPQDEVIFPCPYWVSYPEMVKLCGGKPVPVKPEDGTFSPRLQDIEQVMGPYTKAVIINSPNNPSGVMYSEEFIAGIVEFCEQKNIYLIIDDIYQRLVFDGKKPLNCYDYAKDLSENSKLIVVNGVSKQYAMTGFRIGWAVASKNCVDSLRTTLQNNRNILMTELNGFNGVHVEKPDGTFYCFPDFSNYGKDSVKLSQFILDKVMVVTVPGIEFGMEGHLRLSYCGSIKDITVGIERMKWCLDPDSPNEIYINERKLVRDWA
jgi:aspartate aminotransferase